ncbi:MAG: hypothetical protein GC206_13955 [Alphaproteobacteria bacterium]|nr:hypothetical protein [Alphaproteobacteria bacterium]
MITVSEHEAGLKYVRGKLVGTIGPGRYATWPSPVEVHRVDLREQSLSVPGQEMLTADKMPVRASLIVHYRVADALLHARASTAPLPLLYQAAQVALREAVARVTLDALLADRGVLTAQMPERLGGDARRLGFELVKADLLDLTLTGPAKQAFADLWKAQKEGLAALERARGEQAALRALANAARMLKGNPELMNLRVLQALQAQPGKAPPTIVLGAGGGLLPVAGEPAADAVGEDG